MFIEDTMKRLETNQYIIKINPKTDKEPVLKQLKRWDVIR